MCPEIRKNDINIKYGYEIMSRKLREWYKGACYHLMARGNRRSALFKSEEDFRVFLMQLIQIQEKYPFDLHEV